MFILIYLHLLRQQHSITNMQVFCQHQSLVEFANVFQFRECLYSITSEKQQGRVLVSCHSLRF